MYQVAEKNKFTAGKTFLEIIFPGCCLVCGATMLFRDKLEFPVCSKCLESLQPISAGRRCLTCSLPLISESSVCTRCRQRSFTFQHSFSIYEYRGTIREIISQYKFSNRRRLASLLADLLAPHLEQRYPDLPVVPVPGSRHSVRKRGWDPMNEVARMLESRRGVSVFPVLIRGRGKPQKGLPYEVRLENIRGTVAVRCGSRSLPDEVLLVDDIFTTGATADECSKALVSHGVKKVDVLTLAID